MRLAGMSPSALSRRGFLQTTAAGRDRPRRCFAASTPLRRDADFGLESNIHHSVCKWCYPKSSVDELCAAGKEMGLTSVELLPPSDFPTLKKHGLTCAMVSGTSIKAPDGTVLGPIPKGFNRKEHHDLLAQACDPAIEAVADAGFKNLICFSGNREGMDEETGLKNCAEGLKKLMPLAEKRGVILCMELLNSRVNHPDYMCDHSAWGIELCKRVGSANFKLLYDIYHMQIMEGDVIATIQRSHEYFAHYHTAGVPGRHEIDDTQELNYPAIMRAILRDRLHRARIPGVHLRPKPEPLVSLQTGRGNLRRMAPLSKNAASVPRFSRYLPRA